MQKSDILKIGVLIITLAFVLEPLHFANNLFGNNNSPQNNGQRVEGTATVSALVRNYDPILIASDTIDQKTLDEIRADPVVRNIRNIPSYVVFDLDSRDDVFPFANKLRSKNISTLANAYLILPNNFYLNNGTESFNITATTPIFNVQIEPIVEAGEEILIKIEAIAVGNKFVELHDYEIVSEEKNYKINATISSLESATYNFNVPWENRTSVNVTNYKLKNTVIVTPQLTQIEILQRKKLPYITYIDSKTLEIEPNFTDRAKIESDFSDSNHTISFVPSTYSITSNSSNLSFSNYSSASYTYVLTLPDSVDGHQILIPQTSWVTNNKTNLNTTVNINLYVRIIGNKIVNYLIDQ